MNWEEKTLGEFIHVKHGYAFKSEFFSDEGEHIVLTPGNFYEEGGYKDRGDKDRFYTADYPAQYLLSKGDLIVAMTEQGAGLLGSAALVPEDNRFLHNQRLGLVQITDPAAIDPFFLYKLFNTEIVRQQISASATGTKVRHTAPERIYKCRVKLPSLKDQKKITCILSAYDTLIENNLKRIKLLEELAQLSYEQWFVRLEFPEAEKTSINIETKLPEGWQKRPVSSLAEYLNGYAFKPDHLGDVGYPIIKIKELKGGVIDGTPRNTGTNIPEKYLVNKGDVLFSWSASLEVVLWQQEKGLLNQHLFKVTPHNKIPRIFLYQALKESLGVFDNLTTGATMKHIKRKELDFVTINVPDHETLSEYSKIVDPLFESVSSLYEQNKLLEEARDILLPRLMTGLIDIDKVVLPDSLLTPEAA